MSKGAPASAQCTSINNFLYLGWLLLLLLQLLLQFRMCCAGSAAGELVWQTSGSSHQLQPPAPPRPQLTPHTPGQGRSLSRRRPAALSQASPTQRHDSAVEQSGPDSPWSSGKHHGFPQQQQRQHAPDTPPDPPDMPGINRAGLLSLRNKLRLNRPALISPPTNSYSSSSIRQSPGSSHGTGDPVDQENLDQPYSSAVGHSTGGTGSRPAAVATAGSGSSAVAAARLARRRSGGESQANPGADPSRVAGFGEQRTPGDASRVSDERASPQRALLRKTSSGKTPSGAGQHTCCGLHASLLMLLHPQLWPISLIAYH